MLKKISRTHRKRFRNFLKDFRRGSGVKIKTQCENSKKVKEYEINSNNRPRPNTIAGSGPSRCLRGHWIDPDLANPRSNGEKPHST
jgi:hypothetical protein